MMGVACCKTAAVVALFALASSCRRGEGDSATSEGISITGVVATAQLRGNPADSAVMVVYATVENHGAAADTLLLVETPAARSATIHETMQHGAMMMMMPAHSAVVVAANSTMRLQPGGVHVMLEGFTRLYAPGDTVPLALVFKRAGRKPVFANVVSYDQIERALAP